MTTTETPNDEIDRFSWCSEYLEDAMIHLNHSQASDSIRRVCCVEESRLLDPLMCFPKFNAMAKHEVNLKKIGEGILGAMGAKTANLNSPAAPLSES